MDAYAKSDSRIFALGGILMIALMVFSFWNSAFAAIGDDEVSMEVVKFQDLDVSTPAGTAALYWRIHRAANRVCGVNEHSVLPSLPRQRCAQDAEARAVGQLNFSRLTAYYQAKTGKLLPTRISMAK